MKPEKFGMLVFGLAAIFFITMAFYYAIKIMLY